ncbi:MAG TPA: DUF4118 domain-containing protein [Acidimicrobiia bacterium]|jgi:two-component system sensor histidine kinase KdpD
MARGHLRVYLGAAPGVGKTFAMLNEGRRRAARGTDVVVGYVETHARANTAAQVGDLDVVQRRRIEYRATAFDEMDVDALIARKPAVALIDELAHTNVPGSRNVKRWQDVVEVLDAGIDVISTVNIQHLESLHDVVEQITGIDQQETVPDGVVRSADQVELIDQTPEALRRRMAHGNIYASDKVDAALGNYFRVGNLTALRELALLWLADKVDASLLDYRERHDIDTAWETKERVVVALTGAPGGDDLIRRAARMARRAHGELIGVHVVRSDGLRAGHAGGAETIAERVALLEEVGGRYVEVTGQDVADALLHVATAENATQVVLGASRESRVTEMWRGSVVRKLLRNARGRLDVHVISSPSRSDESGPQVRTFTRLPRFISVGRNRRIAGFILAFAGLPLLTLCLIPARHSLGFQNAILCYLLAVVLIATVGGVLPALVASVFGFLLLNYYFAPPIHTFTISNGRDVLALIAFLVIGGVVSVLVDLAAGRRAEAYQARAEARMLATMAGITVDDPDPLPRLLEQIGSTFALDNVRVLAHGDDGTWHVEARAPGEDPAAATADATRAVGDGVDDASFDPELAVNVPGDACLAWSGRNLTAEEREVLASFTTQIALARHRRLLQREAEQAIAQARANELRNALLAAVSHDLRTPLASIRAAATSLLATDVEWPADAREELLHTIDDEAARLNDLVGNLLDMSRLRSGEVAIRPQIVDVEEIVGAALASLRPAPDAVAVDVAAGLPLMTIDAALLERVLANLIGNALRWTPPGVPVRVEVAALGDSMHLRIVDRGPGIPVSERERVVLPFQRLGDQPAGLGVGLGLAVAKGFIEAIGGELRIEDTPGGGATMVVVVPIGAPVTVPEPTEPPSIVPPQPYEART